MAAKKLNARRFHMTSKTTDALDNSDFAITANVVIDVDAT